MGMQLYAKGAFLEPLLRRAEPNTFGANRLKLEPHGLAEQVRDINLAGVRIARAAAAGAAFVVRPFPKKANVEVPSPTEILIDDDKAWEIVRGGVTMLVGMSDGAVATFPLVANVYRLRPGTITTESALPGTSPTS
jgi:hypothetical protein